MRRWRCAAGSGASTPGLAPATLTVVGWLERWDRRHQDLAEDLMQHPDAPAGLSFPARLRWHRRALPGFAPVTLLVLGAHRWRRRGAP
jgi:hypothetical protein